MNTLFNVLIISLVVFVSAFIVLMLPSQYQILGVLGCLGMVAGVSVYLADRPSLTN